MSLLLLFNAFPIATYMDAGTGAFALDMKSAGLLRKLTLQAATEAVSVLGFDSRLTVGRVLSGQSVSVTFTGIDAGLNVSRKLGAGTASYLVVGADGQLHLHASLPAGVCDVIVTGIDVALTPHHTVSFSVTLEHASRIGLECRISSDQVGALDLASGFSSALGIGSVNLSLSRAENMVFILDEAQ